MKCFVLASSPTLTGRTAVVVELARRLAAARVDVQLFSDTRRTGDLRGWLRHYGLTERRELVLSTVARPDQYPADVIRLARILKRERPDAILCAETNDRVLARWACRLSATRPVVAAYAPTPLDLQPVPPRTPNWVTRLAAVRPVLGTSAPTHKNFLYAPPDLTLLPSVADVFDSVPTVAVGPLVDTVRFSPPTDEQKQAARAYLKLPAEARVVGWVGRIKAGRGALGLLDAFSRVAAAYPMVQLLVIGFGERLPLLQWRAQRLGLSQRVQFAGFRREDLPRCYHAMDALCLTAIGKDGLGRAGLEAAASAVPSWVVAQAPWADWAENGAGCSLVVSPDERDDGWTSALTEIAAAADLAARGASACEWVSVRQLDGARLMAALLAPEANAAESMW